ncbi:hypothetical protein Tco_0764586, partial [Tanacetum coccineum]
MTGVPTLRSSRYGGKQKTKKPQNGNWWNKNGRFGEAVDVLHSTVATAETELVESSLNEPFISTAYNALESESCLGIIWANVVELIGLLVAVGMMLSIGRRLSMTAAGVILVVIEIIDQCTIITTPMFITTNLSSKHRRIQMSILHNLIQLEWNSTELKIGSLALSLAAAAMTDGKHKTPAIAWARVGRVQLNFRKLHTAKKNFDKALANK